MSFEISVPDGPQTFTSGRSHDGTFTVYIRGETPETFELHADTHSYEDQDALEIRSVSCAVELPDTVYTIEGAEKMNVSLAVCRGPEHPQEIEEFEVTIQAVVDGNVVSQDSITLEG